MYRTETHHQIIWNLIFRLLLKKLLHARYILIKSYCVLSSEVQCAATRCFCATLCNFIFIFRLLSPCCTIPKENYKYQSLIYIYNRIFCLFFSEVDTESQLSLKINHIILMISVCVLFVNHYHPCFILK